MRATFITGAEEAIRSLHASGHVLVLVADGKIQSFENVYRDTGLLPLFSARIYSQAVGAAKPSARMFQAAMGAVGLNDADRWRIVMVGNNLAKDVKGANDMGIRSVWMNWSDNYRKEPSDASEMPKYTVSSPEELVRLVEQLDREMLD